ncbi:RNA polymerase sigma-70 factor [Phocaeicola sp.]
MNILFRKRYNKEAHFEQLFMEMYPRLVRYATTLMGDADEAKDIVSETMEQAWKEFDKLEADTRSAWMYAAVRNGCLNRLKHLNVEQQHINSLIEATRTDMSNSYREHEALLQQAECIARSLPEPTCTILRLCYWEKKTYQQVAGELGISPDTVKKHISKALRTLREAMLQKEEI